MENLT
jgi:hypothetical protein